MAAKVDTKKATEGKAPVKAAEAATEVKTAEKTVVKAAEKAPEVKEAAKAVAKAEEKPAAAPAKEAEKAPAKKAAAKTTAKKTTATKKAAAVKESVYLQYAGKELEASDLVARAKELSGVKTVKEIEVYVKPEENMVYYVVNGEEGSFEI